MAIWIGVQNTATEYRGYRITATPPCPVARSRAACLPAVAGRGVGQRTNRNLRGHSSQPNELHRVRPPRGPRQNGARR